MRELIDRIHDVRLDHEGHKVQVLVFQWMARCRTKVRTLDGPPLPKLAREKLRRQGLARCGLTKAYRVHTSSPTLFPNLEPHGPPDDR